MKYDVFRRSGALESMGDNLNTSSPWLRLGFLCILLDSKLFGVAKNLWTTCGINIGTKEALRPVCISDKLI